MSTLLKRWTVNTNKQKHILPNKFDWLWMLSFTAYQSINQTSIAPISPAKPGLVARQPNQCSTAKSRNQFRNINRPWGVWRYPWLQALKDDLYYSGFKEAGTFHRNLLFQHTEIGAETFAEVSNKFSAAADDDDKNQDDTNNADMSMTE